MPELSTQLREYLDATTSPLQVEDVLDDIVRVPPRQIPPRRSTTRSWVYGVASAVAMLALILGVALLRPGGNENEVVEPTPPRVPESPFVGRWVANDLDGSLVTASFQFSDDGGVEMTANDEYASVCSGAPSTMTGTGRIEGDTTLVFPEPVLTCDDGSRPESLNGTPLEELLLSLSFTYHPASDTLADSTGTVWAREGSQVPDPVSGEMWPQSSRDAVRAAQERADAGDPGYTWQLGTQLTEEDPWMHVGEFELTDRFLREVLGWEAYLFEGMTGHDGDGWADGFLDNLRFLRCVPGRPNPLYLPGPDAEPGESCRPTIDALNYESVIVDLAQPDRKGLDGIWVVDSWTMTAPFTQADPAVVEAEARERLQEFLDARISGQGAERVVGVICTTIPDCGEFPLLYATTSGARYERVGFARVEEPEWPDAAMTFRVRLFADGGATVVDQSIRWLGRREGFTMEYGATTENGRLVPVPYYFFDGEIVASAPGRWWEEYWTDEQARFIDFTDPVAPDPYGSTGCEPAAEPGDAAAIAERIMADPNFDATAPVTTRVGGFHALSLDISLAPGVGSEATCWRTTVPIGVWIYSLAPGLRQRLYLVDVPEGMSMQTLAITVTGHESRFEEILEEAQPIIDSIEFHPG